MTTITAPPKRTIGEHIRLARKHTGLNQTNFGRKLGVHQTKVSRWESDKEVPDLLEWKAIADLSGADYILDLHILFYAWQHVSAGVAA
jgi:transcriptional regulator with XRE-family HTH domain